MPKKRLSIHHANSRPATIPCGAVPNIGPDYSIVLNIEIGTTP